MKALGTFVKSLAAMDDLPAGIDAKSPLEGNQFLQNLRYPAPLAGRIDMHHLGPLERRRQLLQMMNNLAAGHLGVAIEQ